MARDLGHTRKNWGTQDWGESNYSGITVCTYIVLIGTELAALSCDFLEVLLSGCVGIANLEQQSLFTNWLTMELFDDFFTNVTALEAKCMC